MGHGSSVVAVGSYIQDRGPPQERSFASAVVHTRPRSRQALIQASPLHSMNLKSSCRSKRLIAMGNMPYPGRDLARCASSQTQASQFFQAVPQQANQSPFCLLPVHSHNLGAASPSASHCRLVSRPHPQPCDGRYRVLNHGCSSAGRQKRSRW